MLCGGGAGGGGVTVNNTTLAKRFSGLSFLHFQIHCIVNMSYELKQIHITLVFNARVINPKILENGEHFMLHHKKLRCY